MGHRCVLQLHAEVPGRPSGLAPVWCSGRARSNGASSAAVFISICSCSRDYWVRGAASVPITMSSALVCALDEGARDLRRGGGFEARWSRHERNHLSFLEGAEVRITGSPCCRLKANGSGR